jgi:hypothetical protein
VLLVSETLSARGLRATPSQQFESQIMDTLTLIRQGLLFVHAVTFAIALSAVLREDVALIKARRIDPHRLADTARTLTSSLIALWVTGLTLVALDVGLDLPTLIASPKLAAKLFVVSALTANGLALHTLAFPMLRRPQTQTRLRLFVPVVLGAISTVSWLYASFIGVARLIAPSMSFTEFIALYGALLTGAIAVALLFVRPRVARLFVRPRVARLLVAGS